MTLPLYSATPQGNQGTDTVIQYPTQSQYPDIELTYPGNAERQAK